MFSSFPGKDNDVAIKKVIVVTDEGIKEMNSPTEKIPQTILQWITFFQI